VVRGVSHHLDLVQQYLQPEPGDYPGVLYSAAPVAFDQQQVTIAG
jgi:hypothetical protein